MNTRKNTRDKKRKNKQELSLINAASSSWGRRWGNLIAYAPHNSLLMAVYHKTLALSHNHVIGIRRIMSSVIWPISGGGTCVLPSAFARLSRCVTAHTWADRTIYRCPYMAISDTNSHTHSLACSLMHAPSPHTLRAINAIAFKTGGQIVATQKGIATTISMIDKLSSYRSHTVASFFFTLPELSLIGKSLVALLNDAKFPKLAELILGDMNETFSVKFMLKDH